MGYLAVVSVELHTYVMLRCVTACWDYAFLVWHLLALENGL